MKTFSELIDTFGIAELAEILDTEPSHVRAMKARDSIAPEHWETLIEAARRLKVRGITSDSLLAMIPRYPGRGYASRQNNRFARAP